MSDSSDDSPAVQFERYLAEHAAGLPERYRNPGRRKPPPRLITSYRLTRFWMALVGLMSAIIGGFAVWWMGLVNL